MTTRTLALAAALLVGGCAKQEASATLSTEERVELLEKQFINMNKRLSEYYANSREFHTEEIVQLQSAVGGLMKKAQESGLKSLAEVKEPIWPIMGYNPASGLWHSGAIPPDEKLPDGTTLDVSLSNQNALVRQWIRRDGNWVEVPPDERGTRAEQPEADAK